MMRMRMRMRRGNRERQRLKTRNVICIAVLQDSLIRKLLDQTLHRV